MDVFLAAVVKPFMLLVVLVIAWPVKRAVELYMPDNRLKRALLKRRGARMQAWFERQDAKFEGAVMRAFRAVTGRPRRP